MGKSDSATWDGVTIFGLDGEPTTPDEVPGGLYNLYGVYVDRWNWTPPCYKLTELKMFESEEDSIPLTVLVLDVAGEPAPDVQVVMAHNDGRVVYDYRTNRLGIVEFFLDKSFRYTAFDVGGGPWKVMVENGAGDGVLNHGRVLVMRAPDRVLNMTFQWQDAPVPPPPPPPPPLDEKVRQIQQMVAECASLIDTALAGLLEE